MRSEDAQARDGEPEPSRDRPASADAVVARLAERFAHLPPQLQVAARHVIDNPLSVGVQSMRALAADAQVHPNTLVRLARAVGFDGWEGLRERFRHFVVTDGIGGFRERADWLGQMAAKGGAAAVVAGMAEATAANLEAMWAGQDPEALGRIADAMIAADRVYVLGMGSAYALAHQFWYVARMGFEHIQPVPRHGSQPVDDLAWAREGDLLVALTFQPYRAETIAAAEAARAKGTRIAAITDSRTSPLARLADHLLVTPTNTPQFFQSHAAATALLEGLLAVLVARGGEQAAERIDRFHRERLRAGLYAEPAALSRLA